MTHRSPKGKMAGPKKRAQTRFPEQGSRRLRQEAVRRLVKMRLPVAEWPQMEEEIAQGSAKDRSGRAEMVREPLKPQMNTDGRG